MQTFTIEEQDELKRRMFKAMSNGDEKMLIIMAKFNIGEISEDEALDRLAEQYDARFWNHD